MCNPWSTPHNSNLATKNIQKQKDCKHYEVTYFTFLPSKELTAMRKQIDGVDDPAVRDNDWHI
jgi:hypothetical protein